MASSRPADRPISARDHDETGATLACAPRWPAPCRAMENVSNSVTSGRPGPVGFHGLPEIVCFSGYQAVPELGDDPRASTWAARASVEVLYPATEGHQPVSTTRIAKFRVLWHSSTPSPPAIRPPCPPRQRRDVVAQRSGPSASSSSPGRVHDGCGTGLAGLLQCPRRCWELPPGAQVESNSRLSRARAAGLEAAIVNGKANPGPGGVMDTVWAVSAVPRCWRPMLCFVLGAAGNGKEY